MSKEYFLVQSVKVNGNDVLVEHVSELAYIEVASMDGNKLVMNVQDQAGIYRDNYELRIGAEVEITFADVNERGDSVWIERFIVARAPVKDGLLEVEAFQKDAKNLKEPSVKVRFFVEMQPKDILSELLPHLKIDCDTFEKGATYHLNAGGTKSRLIRSMARDYGAVCFICRGTLYFKSLKQLAMTEAFKLEHSNPENAEHSIARYSIIGEEDLFKRVLNRNYATWDTVTGMSESGTGPATLISVNQIKALNNQSIGIIPVIDVELTGHTQFKPIAVCSVILHKQLPQSEVDESMPELQIINRVTHYQKGNRYQCRIELGVKNL